MIESFFIHIPWCKTFSTKQSYNCLMLWPLLELTSINYNPKSSLNNLPSSVYTSLGTNISALAPTRKYLS